MLGSDLLGLLILGGEDEVSTATIEEAFRYYLNSNLDCPIYFGMAPKDTSLPYLILNNTSEERGVYLKGSQKNSVYTFKITIYASTKEAAWDYKYRIRDLLHGYAGRWLGRKICHVKLEDSSDDTAPPFNGSDRSCPSIELDYSIRAKDS